ncbi:hypothetical protein ACF0H5_014810 [Mactra antiquata]
MSMSNFYIAFDNVENSFNKMLYFQMYFVNPELNVYIRVVASYRLNPAGVPALHCIGTCMCLHNLAIDRKIALPDPPVRPHDLVADIIHIAPADNNGEIKRRWITQHLPNN